LLSLRYRNAIPFDYQRKDLLEYLEGYLNVLIKLPEWLPGEPCEENRLATLDLNISFNLTYPKGKGILRIVTGTKKIIDPDTGKTETPEHLVFELEVVSLEDGVPPLTDTKGFAAWLDSAHNVIHEWFSSLIEGPLEKQLGLEKLRKKV
jgi:uncharacterized protein (TIGR04255 family)